MSWSSRRPRRARPSATCSRRSRRSRTIRRRGRSSCSDEGARPGPGRGARRAVPGGRLTISSATYDGDTPAPIRSAIRGAGQVVVTNPDMLHSAILPHHTKWSQPSSSPGHRDRRAAHLPRRVREPRRERHPSPPRLCAHYGSRPIIVCCSATIANPLELASADRAVAGPRGPQRARAASGVLLVEPPLADRATSARGSSMTVAHRWAMPFLRAGRQTVVFGRSRTGVESCCPRSARHHGPRTRSRVEAIAAATCPRASPDRAGAAWARSGVVATNALEFRGGHRPPDVSILAGYPGRSRRPGSRSPGRAARRDQRRDPGLLRRAGGSPSTTRVPPSASPRRRGSTPTTSMS